MKPSQLFVLFALLITISAPVFSQTAQGDASDARGPQGTYRIGERLTYDVSFSNFQNAAHVELFVAARGNFLNRDGIQLRGHVETTGIVNASLYSINNDYTTFIDPVSGAPYRSEELATVSGHTTTNTLDFGNPPETDTGNHHPSTFPGTYDFLSALYKLRTLPLGEGGTFSFAARSSTTEYEAEVKVLGREMIKTNVGSFNALVTQIRANGNSEVNDLKIRVYFGDDERHVPLLITFHKKAGDVRVALAGFEVVPTEPVKPTVPIAAAPKPPRTPVVLAGASLPGLPFAVGEQLNFNVYLGTQAQPVATASFQVKSHGKYFNHDGLLLTTTARTNGIVARVFTANDQINSYVDPTTLVPFRTEEQLQEGKRHLNQIVTIDQDRGTATTDAGKRMEIPVGTHDVLSVFYALRAFNLAPGRTSAVSLLLNNRPLTLFVKSLKREKIDLNGQSISALRLSITTDDPVPDKYQIILWVGDDRRRIPLRVTATTPAGPIRSDLAIIPVSQQ